MAETTKELIQEIQNKIQFVITITIFLLAVFQNYFKLHEDEAKGSDIFIKYSFVIFFYLIFYLIFDWKNLKMSLLIAKTIKFLLIAVIIFLASAIFVIIGADQLNTPLGFIYVKTIFPVSLLGMLVVPVILILVLLMSFLVRFLGTWNQSQKKGMN